MSQTTIEWPEIEGAEYTADDDEVEQRFVEVAKDHSMDVDDLVEDVMFMADMGGTGELTPAVESYTAGEAEEQKDWRLEALRVWKNLKGYQ